MGKRLISSNTQTGAQPFLLLADEHINNADATSVVSKSIFLSVKFWYGDNANHPESYILNI